MALIVLHVSQGGRNGLGELWEALLGASLWDSGLLPFLWISMTLQYYLLLGLALPKILVLLVPAMPHVQRRKAVGQGLCPVSTAWLAQPGSICCWAGWELCWGVQECPVSTGHCSVTTVRELCGPAEGQLCDHPLQAAAESLPFCQGRRDFSALSISCPVLLLTFTWVFMSSESHCSPFSS